MNPAPNRFSDFSSRPVVDPANRLSFHYGIFGILGLQVKLEGFFFDKDMV